jgi:hypothetical protein
VLGTGDRWFWPRFEPFYSDFGAAWSVLLPVFPVGALVLWRQRRGAPPERLAATLFLCAVAALTLPTRYRVDGTLNSFPRYLMFLPLVMADVALVPLVVLASERFRGAVTRALIVVFGALSIWNQTRVGGQDLFAPVAYLKHIIRTPDFRDPAFEGRASVAVDYFVGPRDRVAIDGDFGAWIYPAYGRGLTRQVEVLPYDDAARLEGARRADWVAIDRYWSICWGAPDFQDMMHIRIRKGAPTPRDVTVLAALDRDPQFKLVWSEPSMGQFLYKRRGQARL